MGGGIEGQTYCLRWNNHKSNLVEILDVLIQKECYVDCTIYVDGQEQFKAHRVVLAANSPYFQKILQNVPMDHCSILVPGVQAFEMRALIEYMYTGEVNVTESQIPRIMKIAEQLEVKGLFDMTDLKGKFDRFGISGVPSTAEEGNASTATAAHHYTHNSSVSSNNGDLKPIQASSPIITTSTTNISSAQSSSPTYNYKLPYGNLLPQGLVQSLSGTTTTDTITERTPHPPAWPAMSAHHHHHHQLTSPLPSLQPPQPHLQNAAAAMLSSVYESGSDMNPLKRKKISSITSMLMSRDTPILRNVLAQSTAADSSQPVSLSTPIMNDRSDRHSNHSNGTDYSDKKIKYEEPHSPYTDKSFDDDTMDPSQNYPTDSRIASYVPTQKPEWKRYKQYTRADILSAIECVRNGMSALKASRQFGVPSRTLYDKVKKLGITTGRPMNRTMKRSPSNGGGGGGSPAGFPYGISGTSSPYGHHHDNNQSYGGHNQSQSHHQNDSDERHDMDRSDREHNIPPTISQPAAALLDARFLQHALEAGGGDIAGREALHAMAFAAAAHAAVNGMSTSPGTHGTARSPSPSLLMKFARPQAALSCSPSNGNNTDRDQHLMSHRQQQQHDERHQLMDNDDDDHVEDLSMTKKEVEAAAGKNVMETSPPPHLHQISPAPQTPPAQQLGVIVPPQTKVISHSIEDSVLNMKRETIGTGDDDLNN